MGGQGRETQGEKKREKKQAKQTRLEPKEATYTKVGGETNSHEPQKMD